MLDPKHDSEWKAKIKSIFTEAQELAQNDVSFTDDVVDGSDVDGDTSVDDVDTTDTETDASPTITLTAELLKSLLEYCAAPDEEETNDEEPIDTEVVDSEEPVQEDELTSGSSMSMPSQISAGGGIVEDEELGDGGDDTLDADSTEDSVDGVEDTECEELTPDEIVERLVSLSAENEGAPLDVDVLATVFAPEDDSSEDLGTDSLDSGVDLPATSGDETLAEDEAVLDAPAVHPELAKKERALAHWETLLATASPEDAEEIKHTIESIKSAIARIKAQNVTKSISQRHNDEANTAFKTRYNPVPASTGKFNI